MDSESKHMSTPVYLQYIHSHIRWAGQHTWLRLNRVCSNIRRCLSGTLRHWSLRRRRKKKKNTHQSGKTRQTVIPVHSRHSSFSLCSPIRNQKKKNGDIRNLPAGHSQTKRLTWSRHLPWFRQGELRHSFTSLSQWVPPKPENHDEKWLKEKRKTNKKTISKLTFYLKSSYFFSE